MLSVGSFFCYSRHAESRRRKRKEEVRQDAADRDAEEAERAAAYQKHEEEAQLRADGASCCCSHQYVCVALSCHLSSACMSQALVASSITLAASHKFMSCCCLADNNSCSAVTVLYSSQLCFIMFCIMLYSSDSLQS